MYENNDPKFRPVVGCARGGLTVNGKAMVGSYLSAHFACNNNVQKLSEIQGLLAACGANIGGVAITSDQLCLGGCADPTKTCQPTTLQSRVNDDADLTLHGPDANGNCYYELVITGQGNVDWSAAPGTCTCM